MSRPVIPVEVSQLANALAAADDSPFSQAFRTAWPEALAKALAEAAAPPKVSEKPALSLEEVTLLTPYSVSTISRAVRDGSLRAVPHVQGRTVIARKELDRWLEATAESEVRAVA